METFLSDIITRRTIALANLVPQMVLTLLLVSPVSHSATELVMLEEPGCAYCEKFNHEIAPAYALTDEGKQAPLRRIMLHEPWPADLTNVKSDTVTPTFILVSNDKEIGRLRGYQGDEYFWFLLGELLNKIPKNGISTLPDKNSRAVLPDSEQANHATTD